MANELREQLAALAHEQWSGWMRYLFGKCGTTPLGQTMIPHWAVLRWQRQMATPYAQLSEEEKESDRKEADRVLALVGPLREALEGVRANLEATRWDSMPGDNEGPNVWAEARRGINWPFAMAALNIARAVLQPATEGAKCWCHLEAGDSPCPLHGMDEPPAPSEAAAPGAPGYYDDWTAEDFLSAWGECADELKKVEAQREAETRRANYTAQHLQTAEAQLAASQARVAELERDLYNACAECGSADPNAPCPLRDANARADAAEKEVEKLRQRVGWFSEEDYIDTLEKERDAVEKRAQEAEAQVAEMVQKAAANNLEGYRALAAKLKEAEAERLLAEKSRANAYEARDAARAQLAAAQRSATHYRELYYPAQEQLAEMTKKFEEEHAHRLEDLEDGDKCADEADALRAQLAEAVGLLRAPQLPGWRDVVRTFLAAFDAAQKGGASHG